MPLYGQDPKNSKHDKQDSTPEFKSPEELKTSTVYNSDNDIKNITRYIDGYKWSVDYYQQVINVNDQLELPDINIHPSSQKYYEIKDLVIHMQDTIEPDNPTNIEGTAVINSGFMPNKNDVFIADIIGGRKGVFSVEKVDTQHYNLHDVYLITFKLFFFPDSDTVLYNDILNKAVKNYVYDDDHLIDHSAPVILKSDYKDKLTLKRKFNEIVEHYMIHMINSSKSVISPPTQTSIYVDTLLDNFIFKILNVSEHSKMLELNKMEIEINEKLRYSIWDALLKRNIDLVKRCNTNIDFSYLPYTPVSSYGAKQMNYLGINFAVDLIDSTKPRSTPEYQDISIEGEYSDDLLPIEDDSYVLSENFYTMNEGSYSKLESVVISYLKGDVVNIDVLTELIDSYEYWSTRDQFYYIPILLLLIKDATMHTFRSI